jgi:hypothetical protein
MNKKVKMIGHKENGRKYKNVKKNPRMGTRGKG